MHAIHQHICCYFKNSKFSFSSHDVVIVSYSYLWCEISNNSIVIYVSVKQISTPLLEFFYTIKLSGCLWGHLFILKNYSDFNFTFSYTWLFLLPQELPQVLLCRVHFLKEALLLPALSNRDEKVIGGLACLLSEIGQAVSIIYECLFRIFCILKVFFNYEACSNSWLNLCWFRNWIMIVIEKGDRCVWAITSLFSYY